MADVRAQMWIILIITAISTAVGIEEENSTSHFIPCNEGWYPFGEKCYKSFGHKNLLSWTEAAKSCVVQGGYLATIGSQELQDFLTSYFVLNEQKLYTWSGLTFESAYESQLRKTDQRFKPNGGKVVITYAWHDGSIVNYTNWDRGSPIIPRGVGWVECASISLVAYAGPGKWYSSSCSAPKPYVCQSNKSKEANSSDPRFCAPEKGGGWKYLNSCYHIVTEDESWDDAEKYCHQNLDAHLVSILNKKNNIFLSHILSSADLDFWIGVKMRDQEVQKWSSGWHVAFNNWYDDQEFTKGKCGLRTKYGHWITVDCAEKHPFVCEVSSKKPPVYEQGREGWRCPDSSSDWKDFDGETCYIFETWKFLSWYEANYACMTKGGTLTAIRSEAESEIIRHHLTDTKVARLHIGLHRKLDNKSAFEWTDGTEVNFVNWFQGQPYDEDKECVTLSPYPMKWDTVPCDEKQEGYICSAKKLPPILYDENYEELLSQDDIKAEKGYWQGDKTAQTVITTMVCSFTIMILIGMMVYFFKTRCLKDIRFPPLHNVVFNRT